MAHSTSCGCPYRSATARASAATAAACSAVSTAPPPGPDRVIEATPSRVTVHSSPIVSPDTGGSPSPATAVTIVVSRSPVTGWAVNATPAATGSTMT
jgi:hypothetical protein